MTELLKRLWTEEQAESLLEYALLLLLVSMTAITAMGGLASAINNCYFSTTTRVEAASHGGSLTSGSLDYGAQTRTDTTAFSKAKKSLKDE